MTDTEIAARFLAPNISLDRKERAIRARNRAINTQIEAELEANQTGAFQYTYPTLDDIRQMARIVAQHPPPVPPSS